MPKKKHKPEEIVAKLRQADVLISQGQDVADVIRQIGVSEVACEMNCSMVKYSTRCVRPKSSSKVGGATSTQSGRMNRWTTSHQHRKCSCPPSPRGRLRYVDRLRRPRWRNGQLSTNIPPGPLDGADQGAIPYVLCMMLAIVILCFFPEIATWLPNHMMGGVK